MYYFVMFHWIYVFLAIFDLSTFGHSITSRNAVCFYGETATRVMDIITNGRHPVLRPRSCSSLTRNIDKSGLYIIHPADGHYFTAFCDMDTDNGGWTVLMKRIDGSESFVRDWSAYEDGFGNIEREFWLGNKNIHILTASKKCVLRVDLENFKGEKVYAKYEDFTIGNAGTNYKLSLGKYSGTAGDALTYNNGCSFTTGDKDNDENKGNCASLNGRKGSGWWYKACEYASLTLPRSGKDNPSHGEMYMQWQKWTTSPYSIKSATMMISC